MRYAKTLGLMLLAVLALGAVMASGASAAEGSLLGATGTATTKDNGSAQFESTSNSIVVKCTSSEGTLTAEGNTKGKADELFLGCTAGGFKCTGLTDTTTGSILAKVLIETVDATVGGKLVLLVIYTLDEPVHFECLGVLTEVRGSVIGQVTNANGEHTTKVTSDLKGTAGVQNITEVEGVKHTLESETGGSAFTQSSQTQNVTATGSEVEVMY